MQARDGLLAHVAALGEADRALVEARLLGDDRFVEVHAVARAPVLDAQHVGRGLVDLHRALVQQRGPHALGVRAVADDVDPQVGADEADRRAGDVGACVRVLRARHRPGERVRVGPDEREQPTLKGALVQLAVEADLEPPQGVEERLEGGSLAEQEQLVAGWADIDHPQVSEHLALVGQQRGVTAAAGRERLDLVADLAVEERLGIGPGERELAARGAVHQRDGLGHGGVGVHRQEWYRPT